MRVRSVSLSALSTVFLLLGCSSGDDSTKDGGSTCGAGTHEQDGTCLPDSTVQGCATGTHEQDGVCVPDTSCGAGTHAQNGACVPDDECGPGTHAVGGVCVPLIPIAGFNVVVTPPSDCGFAISGLLPVQVTVTALGQQGETVADYNGEVRLFGQGAIITTPSTLTLSAGTASAQVMISGAAAAARISVGDVASPAIGGASNEFASVAPALAVTLTAPELVREGRAFAIDASLLYNDCYMPTTFAGTAKVQSYDPDATLVADNTSISGATGTLNVTLRDDEMPSTRTVALVVEIGEGSASAVVDLVPHIQFLGAEFGYGLDSQARVSWNQAFGGTGTFTYEVFTAAAPDGFDFATPVQSLSQFPAGPSTTLTATNGSPLYVIVRAVDGLDDGDDANTRVVTVLPGDALYVDWKNGLRAAGPNGSPTNPFFRISDAIASITTGSTARNIYVAQGTYQELSTTQSFAVPAGVLVLGGFAHDTATAAEWAPGAGDVLSTLSVPGDNSAYSPALVLNEGVHLARFAITARFGISRALPPTLVMVQGLGVELSESRIEPLDGVGLFVKSDSEATLFHTILDGRRGDSTDAYDCISTLPNSALSIRAGSHVTQCSGRGVYASQILLSIEQSAVDYVSGDCINAEDTDLSLVSSSVALCGDYGINASVGTNLSITANSNVGEVRSNCIIAQNCGKFELADSSISGCGAAYDEMTAVSVEHASGPVTIIRNRISTADFGVFVSDTQDTSKIGNNEITGTIFEGITINAGNYSHQKTEITNNTVSVQAWNRNAVFLSMGDYGADLVVEGNLVHSQYDGIYVEGTVLSEETASVEVSNNEVWARDGIHIRTVGGTTPTTTIQGNLVNVSGSGIVVGSISLKEIPAPITTTEPVFTISNNIITGNLGPAEKAPTISFGLALETPEAEQPTLTIAGNEVSGFREGVRASSWALNASTSTLVVSGNRLSDIWSAIEAISVGDEGSTLEQHVINNVVDAARSGGVASYVGQEGDDRMASVSLELSGNRVLHSNYAANYASLAASEDASITMVGNSIEGESTTMQIYLSDVTNPMSLSFVDNVVVDLDGSESGAAVRLDVVGLAGLTANFEHNTIVDATTGLLLSQEVGDASPVSVTVTNNIIQSSGHMPGLKTITEFIPVDNQAQSATVTESGTIPASDAAEDQAVFMSAPYAYVPVVMVSNVPGRVDIFADFVPVELQLGDIVVIEGEGLPRTIIDVGFAGRRPIPVDYYMVLSTAGAPYEGWSGALSSSVALVFSGSDYTVPHSDWMLARTSPGADPTNPANDVGARHGAR